MLVRVRSSRSSPVSARSSSARSASRQANVRQARRAHTSAFAPSTGTLQQIDDVVYGRKAEIVSQLKDLKAKGQKVGIDKYNELLGANIFEGDIGGIVDAVNSIVSDGITPNNTTVRLLNFFFGKTDNFVKGEALAEKIENLHNVPKKATSELTATLPAGQGASVLASQTQAEKFGHLLSLSDANASDFVSVFSAWHAAQASKNPAGKDAVKKAAQTALKQAFGGGVGKDLAAKMGVELIPDSAFEDVKGKKKLKDAGWAAKAKTRTQAVKAKLVKSQATIQAVAKYLGSQPFDSGALQVNFADLLSFQRVFQNTHGELKKYLHGVRAVALANLIVHGAPALPQAHPFPALFLSHAVDPKLYDAVSADVQGDSKVVFLPPTVTSAKAVKPLIENHERWFADYYQTNDDLKTY